jgi:hypothetical protein
MSMNYLLDGVDPDTCGCLSEAAVKLTTRMLEYAAEHPDVGRAEALRQSMLELMNDEEKPEFAHPLIWAPFVVVGEGGVRGVN